MDHFRDHRQYPASVQESGPITISLAESHCYKSNDARMVSSCASLPAVGGTSLGASLLASKQFRSRIPIRNSNQDLTDGMPARNSSMPDADSTAGPIMSGSFGHVDIEESPSMPGAKNALKREMSLPVQSQYTIGASTGTLKKDPIQSPGGWPVEERPKYARSKSSLSLTSGSRPKLSILPSPLTPGAFGPSSLCQSPSPGFGFNYGFATSLTPLSIKSSMDTGLNQCYSASSTRCSTPNRLNAGFNFSGVSTNGGCSKIPIWAGSQEKLTVGAKPGGGILPPRPPTGASQIQSKINTFNNKKWESCTNLEVRSRDQVYPALPKKPMSLLLSEKSRVLTESMKQMHQTFSSSTMNLQREGSFNSGSGTMKSKVHSLKQNFERLTGNHADPESSGPTCQQSAPVFLPNNNNNNKPEPSRKLHRFSSMDFIPTHQGLKVNTSSTSISSSSNATTIKVHPKPSEIKALPDSKTLQQQETRAENTTGAEVALQVDEFKQKESKLLLELQDARDQMELLEFRVLELEEETGKASNEQTVQVDTSRGNKEGCPGAEDDVGESGLQTSKRDEADSKSISGDSGCGNSVTAEPADLAEFLQHCHDFKSEKVAAEAKGRLRGLVEQLAGPPADKSLLLQTVAIFEALLKKIRQLQDENVELAGAKDKAGEERCQTFASLAEAEQERDRLALEMEVARYQVAEASKTVSAMTESSEAERATAQRLAAELARAEARSSQLQGAHNVREADLKKQLAGLQSALESARIGREAESEMFQAAVEKRQSLERTVARLTAKLKAMEGDNAQLKEQLLHNALEHDSAKSSGSEEFSGPSKVGGAEEDGQPQNCRKMTGGSSSSGVSSDLSDSDEVDHHDDEEELVVGLGSSRRLLSTVSTQTAAAAATLAAPTSEPNGRGEESDQAALKALSGELREWVAKCSVLQERNRSLLEDKCELEEAENDSRLHAQRLQQLNSGLNEKHQMLQDELCLERRTSSILREELDGTRTAKEGLKLEASRQELMLQNYEQRVFELEESEVDLKEKVSGLEQANAASLWWIRHTFSTRWLVPQVPQLCLLMQESSTGPCPSLVQLPAAPRGLEKATNVAASVPVDQTVVGPPRRRIISRDDEMRHSLRIQVEGLLDRRPGDRQAPGGRREVEVKEAREVAESGQNQGTKHLKSEIKVSCQQTTSTKIQICNRDMEVPILLPHDDDDDDGSGGGGGGGGGDHDLGPVAAAAAARVRLPENAVLTGLEVGLEKEQEAAAGLAASAARSPPATPSTLVRYKSLRDHDGKFHLVVKIQ